MSGNRKVRVEYKLINSVRRVLHSKVSLGHDSLIVFIIVKRCIIKSSIYSSCTENKTPLFRTSYFHLVVVVGRRHFRGVSMVTSEGRCGSDEHVDLHSSPKQRDRRRNAAEPTGSEASGTDPATEPVTSAPRSRRPPAAPPHTRRILLTADISQLACLALAG